MRFRCHGVCFSGRCSRETTASILALTVCPVQTDENIVGQQLPTLLNVTCYVILHTLLHVVVVLLELILKTKQRLENEMGQKF